MIRRLKSALLLFIFPVALSLGATGQRDMVREAEIEAAITKLDPTMLEPFRDARIAFDKDDYATTERLLRVVVQRLPKFDAAFRRLGAALERQGRRADGIAYCEQAIALNRSVANLSTLASILAYPKTGESTPKDKARALDLLHECRSLPRGEDADILFSTTQLVFQLDKRPEARELVPVLEKKFPDEMATHYFAAILAAWDERWGRASREIRTAGRLGLPEKTVQEFLDSGIQSRATAWLVGGIMAVVVGGWAVGLIVLFGLGIFLSKTTLRQANNADVTVSVGPGEQRLRRLYRGVMNVAGVYYYISLPIVLVLVIAVCAAIVLFFLSIGYVPIKLMVIAVFGAIATIWTMGRSLFLRVKSEDPGRALERHEAEGLWQLTDEVARTMNTRPIDEVRLTVGTDLAVYERGSWREKLDNKAKRVLILGTAVLHGFKQDDFRSVLAHEYGHFSNRDTAGGDIAMRVQNDMLKFYFAMRDAGQATWLNVAFHFLRMYHFIFRRISHGATRLQEILADRVAAQTYGAAAFEGGLRHVIARGIAFGKHADHEINDAIKSSRPLQNLYDAAPADPTSIQEEFEKAINRPTTEDDTHPGPMDRFRLIAKIAPPHPRARQRPRLGSVQGSRGDHQGDDDEGRRQHRAPPSGRRVATGRRPTGLGAISGVRLSHSPSPGALRIVAGRFRCGMKQSTYTPLLHDAKDLSKIAPRSPKMRLGGYALMARMIDKGRATIAGSAGEYKFACPVDSMLFTFKGVERDDVHGVLESGASDQDVLAWFNTHGTPKTDADVKAWSSEVERITYYKHDDPEKRKWFIGECKKLGLDPATATLCDYLEADDKQSFKN